MISGSFRKAGGDALGACNRCTDDHGGGTQIQGAAYLLGVGDVAFYEHRDCQVGHDGLDERPGDGAVFGGLGGVAVEGGGDGVGAGALGGEGVFEGGDVGEDGAVERGVDAADEFGP